MVGSLLFSDAPQLGGTVPLRRSTAVKKAAYDQVRSMAEVCFPSSLENCSESEPLVGVYFCTMDMNPSA